MIVAHFILKIIDKVKDKPETKEDIHRCMKDEYEARRAAARPVIAKLDAISTPRDRSELLARLGTISDLEAALRQHRAPEQCDAMAMAPGRFA